VKLWSKYSAHPIYYYRYGYRHKLGLANLLELPFKIDFGTSSIYEIVWCETTSSNDELKRQKSETYVLLINFFTLLLLHCIFKGVVHTDELLLMFTSMGSPLAKHPHYIKVSNMLVDLWTSFATDG
jgi:hypothetical protein